MCCSSYTTTSSAHAFDALRDNRERGFFEVFVHEWSRHATPDSLCTPRSFNFKHAHRPEGKKVRLRVNEIKMCIATL